MKVVLLLALLTVSECSSSSVVGLTGQDVTLSCTYNSKHYGALSICWGRGAFPNRGCTNQLISTDGRKVIEGTRASSRYQLLGRLDEGDVSLTILNIRDSDAGLYGCRVDIPGWFNDDKHHFDLTIMTADKASVSHGVDAEGQDNASHRSEEEETDEEGQEKEEEEKKEEHEEEEESGAGTTKKTVPAPETTTSTLTTETSTEQTTASYTAGHRTLLTSSSSTISVEVDSLQSFTGNSVRFSFIVFIPALLLTAAYRFGGPIRVQRLTGG